MSLVWKCCYSKNLLCIVTIWNRDKSLMVTVLTNNYSSKSTVKCSDIVTNWILWHFYHSPAWQYLIFEFAQKYIPCYVGLHQHITHGPCMLGWRKCIRTASRGGKHIIGWRKSLPLFRGLNGLSWGERRRRSGKCEIKRSFFSLRGQKALDGWTDTMSNPDWLSRDSKSAHFDSANLGTIHLHQHSLLKTNIMKESNHREIIIWGRRTAFHLELRVHACVQMHANAS